MTPTMAPTMALITPIVSSRRHAARLDSLADSSALRADFLDTSKVSRATSVSSICPSRVANGAGRGNGGIGTTLTSCWCAFCHPSGILSCIFSAVSLSAFISLIRSGVSVPEAVSASCFSRTASLVTKFAAKGILALISSLTAFRMAFLASVISASGVSRLSWVMETLMRSEVSSRRSSHGVLSMFITAKEA